MRCEPLKAHISKPMENTESLSHTRWKCKYHIVFIPKCRRKRPYTALRKELGPVLRSLAEQKECKVEKAR
jgi:putative transposase